MLLSLLIPQPVKKAHTRKTYSRVGNKLSCYCTLKCVTCGAKAILENVRSKLNLFQFRQIEYGKRT